MSLKNNFYLPRRIMDPRAMYVEAFPKNTTYTDVQDTFCPFQRTPPLEIVKKEHYAIINFQAPKTVRKILKKKDTLEIKNQHVTIKEAYNKIKPSHIYLPPSFRLPPTSLVLVPPFLIPIAPAPAPPSSPYTHPFPEGFSYF